MADSESVYLGSLPAIAGACAGRSYNCSTADSESAYLGSNPSLPAQAQAGGESKSRSPSIRLRSLRAIAFMSTIDKRETSTVDKSKVPSEERSDESREKSYFVYILRTSSNTLYIGQTNNLEERLREHKNRTTKSAKYLRLFSSFELVYKEEYSTRVEAMRSEKQLKGWTRTKKEALISGNLNLLKKL